MSAGETPDSLIDIIIHQNDIQIKKKYIDIMDMYINEIDNDIIRMV